MKKTLILTHPVSNLRAFLRNTDADEIIGRTTYFSGGWHDNEFDAQCAGFNLCRFINPEYVRNHTFAACYRLTRN